MNKEKLCDEMNKLYFEYIKVKDQYDKLAAKDQYTELKNKYEGKYFKYLNSYGDNDDWFVYIKVNYITKDCRINISTFQMTVGNEIKIEIGRDVIYNQYFQHRITKNEWNKEFNKVMKKFNTIK